MCGIILDMIKYIALLRGINVGGKNKVSMPILKKTFEDIGFSNVSTYINSGNVLFSSEIVEKKELTHLCKTAISETFLLDIPVAIISHSELSAALVSAPEWWDADSETEIVHNAIFLIPPITVEDVFKSVGDAKEEYEKVAFFENVIFWSAPKETFSKTRWSKVASTSIYSYLTIRNSNTAKKLLQLCDER